MTRFARAQGSKSSNVRTPEDSTPWEVMKEQLLKIKQDSEESKKREEAEQQRIANYENFLKEQKVQKRKAEWCDFPETKSNNNQTTNVNKNKNKKNKQSNERDASDILFDGKDETQSENIKNKKKKKNKPYPEKQPINDSLHLSNGDHSQEVNSSIPNAKPKSKKNKNKRHPEDPSNNSQNVSNGETSTEVNTSITTNVKPKKKNKKNIGNLNDTQNSNQQPSSKPNELIGKNKKKRENPTRRKPINDTSFQLIINSKEVELVRFDGFPIMKRDAERIQELKSNMMKKGIPKSEVQRTIKLERRRAEKALARLKRDVCYNCRKGGHNLSDCPDLKSSIPGVDSADGVCFKCGSTEHRQNECKVQKDKEFRFAKCFICRETGHLARQCPDNPKGLYPNGGSCKLCGDVTHLRKDCPTVKNEKEESSIKLATLDDNIEDLEQHKPTAAVEMNKKPKKVTF